MLRELFRFTISRFHNWNDWWENQFQYFSRWQPLQIFYYMGPRIFEWENILPDRLDTHTNRSMNRSSAISFAVNYSGWIMKCSNCGPIKQWFWLWRRHSEREDDEMKHVKHKRMWNECSSFHWNWCEGYHEKHSHLIAVVIVDLNTDECTDIYPHAPPLSYALTGSTISVCCECACFIEGFPVFFPLFVSQSKRWYLLLLELNILS